MNAILIAAGLALVVTGVLAHLGRLPRNRLAGLRTKATLANDEAWEAAHRASAWSIVLTGLVTLVGGIVLDPNDSSLLLGAGIAVVGIAIVGGVQADRVARRTTAGGNRRD